MADNPKPINYFVRILLSVLCALIAGMILFRYLRVEPIGEISSGLLALVGILVVVVLAESFDNFSIGRLIAISRDARKKEIENSKLEKLNASLLSQLIAISTSQSQRQSSTTVQGDYYATAPVVGKATETEMQERENTESLALEETAVKSRARPSMDWSKAEYIALTRFLKQRNMHISNAIRDPKLLILKGIDSISTIQPIFDAYIKAVDGETFIDIRAERSLSPMYRDRLYVMLSHIYQYRSTKNANVHLDVLVLKVPGEEGRALWGTPYRVFEFFEPAIATGLLQIHEIELSEAEANECRRQ